jgi:hypothetical protein
MLGEIAWRNLYRFKVFVNWVVKRQAAVIYLKKEESRIRIEKISCNCSKQIVKEAFCNKNISYYYQDFHA